MPVSFGTVEIIPQSAAPAAPAAPGNAASARESHAIDPRELAPALRQLADRHARIRAH